MNIHLVYLLWFALGVIAGVMVSFGACAMLVVGKREDEAISQAPDKLEPRRTICVDCPVIDGAKCTMDKTDRPGLR
jgi:hypothetical protein